MRASLRDPHRRALLLAGLLAFPAIGAIQAMYGPAFPGLEARFGVGVDAVGTTVVLHFGGAFVTIAASSFLLARFGYRPVLLASGAAMTAGLLLVATAPTWSWLLAGALLGGLGFGLLNVGFNLLAARVFAPNAAPALNLLSAVFGVGATLAPLAVGAAGSSLRAPALGVAALTVAATLLVLRLPEPARPRSAAGERIPWFAAAGFVAMYFLYVSAESGVAAWETVHLEPLLGARDAAFMTSVYWGALTVGRFLATPLSALVPPRTFVLAASALGLVAVAAAHLPALAPVAWTLAGLAFAPIFPTGLAWVARVFPRRSEAVASVALAVANLGPVLLTAVVGRLVAGVGPGAIPTALTVVMAAVLVVVALLWRGSREP